MSVAMNEEEFFKLLKETAIRRLGEERAKIMEPAIQDICRSLAKVAQQALELEEEPAFFL